MSLKRAYSNVRQGALNHPVKTLFFTYLWIAGIYTMLSTLAFFIPLMEPNSTTWQGIITLLAICLLSGVLAAHHAADPSHVRFYLPPIDTTLEISFGNLFDAKGAKVIAVNEYFDSELGSRVSVGSLHGQLIQRYFNGQANVFEETVDPSLECYTAEEEPCRDRRAKHYPIGTTSVIQVSGEQFFLPALTQTNVQTNKASCDISLFGLAMKKLWDTVRHNVQGGPVNVPLIGSGQAQVDLPPQQLLQLIIMTMVEASKPKITNELRIVLPYACRSKIDLKVIKRNWSERGLS